MNLTRGCNAELIRAIAVVLLKRSNQRQAAFLRSQLAEYRYLADEIAAIKQSFRRGRLIEKFAEVERVLKTYLPLAKDVA
jgi:hypothetical protein